MLCIAAFRFHFLGFLLAVKRAVIVAKGHAIVAITEAVMAQMMEIVADEGLLKVVETITIQTT